MVFQQNKKPNASAAYVNTNVSTKHAIARRYVDLMACYDGSPDANARASPIIDEIFSPELVLAAPDGPRGLRWYKEWSETFIEQRNSARLERIEPTADGIRVVIRNIVGGVDQGPVAQLGKVEDGRITRWSPESNSEENKDGFERLVTSVAANQAGMTGNVQRLRDYLAALDGSPDAFERFEGHIDRVLSKKVTWENDDGDKMNYDKMIELLRDRYIPNGCYPVLESVEVNDEDRTMTVVVKNHLPGEGGEASCRVLYYGDDDLVHRIVSGPFPAYQRIKSLPAK